MAMRPYPQTILVLAILVLTLLLSSSATTKSCAQASEAPVYARQRDHARGDGVWNGGAQYGNQSPGHLHPGHWGGYFPYPSFPFQPAIAGSWYTRPYPHHFDYYRGRY